MRLVTQSELCTILGVVPSTMSNWKKRGTGLELPEPHGFYKSGRGVVPIWTEDQARSIVNDYLTKISARMEAILGS